MSEHTYHLQKYAGTSTRHTCPQCGHKGEFTYYVDERNVPIDESCGRCNRERCGYHLTPSEYFKAHPADKRNEFTTWKQPEPPKAIPISYLPSSLLATDTHRDRNNLFQFMSKEFGDVEANRVFDLYHVGTSRHWRNNDGLSTTFPQINEKGKLCQLKVMAYNPNTGKRMKKQDRAEMWSDKAQKYIPDTRPMDKIWFAGKTLLKNYLLALSSSNWFKPEAPAYSIGMLVYIVLVVLFAYFYTSITFNPLEVANNMKKSGGFIPGIRPGKPTSDYLNNILNYIVFIGACGLVIVCIIPIIASGLFSVGNLSFGGTSLIIIAGVILETIKAVESMMLVRNYKGFLND